MFCPSTNILMCFCTLSFPFLKKHWFLSPPLKKCYIWLFIPKHWGASSPKRNPLPQHLSHLRAKAWEGVWPLGKGWRFIFQIGEEAGIPKWSILLLSSLNVSRSYFLTTFHLNMKVVKNDNESFGFCSITLHLSLRLKRLLY